MYIPSELIKFFTMSPSEDGGYKFLQKVCNHLKAIGLLSHNRERNITNLTAD
jgi:hypothetical protein